MNINNIFPQSLPEFAINVIIWMPALSLIVITDQLRVRLFVALFTFAFCSFIRFMSWQDEKWCTCSRCGAGTDESQKAPPVN